MNQSEHVKEVYAHFGLALYLAQCVEQSMFQLVMMFDFFSEHAFKNLPREDWIERYDSFEAIMSKKTMGQVLGQLRKMKIPHIETESNLKEALKRRNILAHRFFVDHGLNFVKEEGREQMLHELKDHQRHFEKVENELIPIVQTVMKEYGFTEERLQEIERQLEAELWGNH